MPPSAITGSRACRAINPNRAVPNVLAPGWDRVAKTGDRNSASLAKATISRP